MTRKRNPKSKQGASRGRKSSRPREITDYDQYDTSSSVDASKPLRLEDLGLVLPETPPTQVVSIRLPSALLNELRALGSQHDIPYQALIKLFLSEAVAARHGKKAA